MNDLSEFQPYLESIRAAYAKWWQLYTLTDAAGRRRQEKQVAPTFDFGLMVQTVKKEERREEEKVERFPVLDGIRKYAEQHVLLVGRPGSGKSTALARLMLEEATTSQARIPVLVELRYWQGSIEQLILDSLKRHGLAIASLAQVLSNALILFDGVNELPSDEARSQLSAFRRNHPRVPMIFTTRDLSIGGDLGIEKRLEMQPLTEKQMEAFIRSYLPGQAEAMLRQLRDRLREFGQTPLLLWMLCGVFQQTGTIPENLGLVFREFTQGYERYLKDDVRVESDRAWWKPVLQQLAWVMMQGEKPTEFRVAIRYEEAVGTISQFLSGKVQCKEDIARKCLRDLQKYHLIQAGANREELEFRHQLIQEYYAAEALLEQLITLDDERLKQKYLNFLKWTEPVTLMLALVSETQGIRVVKLALEVDQSLGARLAGEVKPAFQENAIGMVNKLKVLKHWQLGFIKFSLKVETPAWLKVELLKKTRSNDAISGLLKLVEDADWEVCRNAVDVLGSIDSDAAISGLLKLVEDADSRVRENAAWALGKLADAAISGLLEILDSAIPEMQMEAAEALGRLGSDAAISGLLKLVEDADSRVRGKAAEALGRLGSDVAIPALLKLMKNSGSSVRKEAAEALVEVGSDATIPALLKLLENSDSSVRSDAAGVLSKIAKKCPQTVAQHLPHLFTLIPTKSGEEVYKVILAIQENCKYYNYEIYQAYLEAQKADRQKSQDSDPTAITVQTIERLTIMTDKAPIFNQQNATIGVNYAAEGSKQEFTQHINGTEQNFEILLTSYKQFIHELQQEHPDLTHETEITKTITVEARRIDARWQNFLSLKRLWNGGKKAAVKVGEHFVESNPWGKGAIAFLEGVSEDVK
ncbi:NACHT domain-containing protein [Leptolyngbya sp. AN03gr2]|uniref:NACHT domain-containing protein n=1 Tax=Leptolyngbya sp. AN03gr2 TaxID=3423364 RepID=UPI003D317168